MRSPSGIVDWLCAKCRSENIVGPVEILHQKSGVCGDCYTWWPWKQRIKLAHYPDPPKRVHPPQPAEDRT